MDVLRSFDLGPVTKRLGRRMGAEKAAKLEAEFRRMATLWLLEPELRVVPSHGVDEYWHDFVLDTERYSKFCQVVLGRFIHHVPGDPDEPHDAASYEETRKAYTRHFGNPGEFWPENAAHCSGPGGHCNSGPNRA